MSLLTWSSELLSAPAIRMISSFLLIKGSVERDKQLENSSALMIIAILSIYPNIGRCHLAQRTSKYLIRISETISGYSPEHIKGAHPLDLAALHSAVANSSVYSTDPRK